MSADKDGGPAFPNVPDGAGDKWADWDKGMTLRDYMASKAMQSILSVLADGIRPIDVKRMAADAYGLADAMLVERAK